MQNFSKVRLCHDEGKWVSTSIVPIFHSFLQVKATTVFDSLVSTLSPRANTFAPRQRSHSHTAAEHKKPRDTRPPWSGLYVDKLAAVRLSEARQGIDYWTSVLDALRHSTLKITFKKNKKKTRI
jgi:hypothetical protein